MSKITAGDGVKRRVQVSVRSQTSVASALSSSWRDPGIVPAQTSQGRAPVVLAHGWHSATQVSGSWWLGGHIGLGDRRMNSLQGTAPKSYRSLTDAACGPEAGRRHLPRCLSWAGIPVRRSHDWILPTARGRLHLGASRFPPSFPPGLLPNQTTTASFCSPVSVSGRPGQPGPPARFTHSFEALMGSQRSWPSAHGPGLVPGHWQPLPA